MKPTLLIASSLLAVVSLAACKQAEAPKPADSGTASGTMANIPITAQMKHGMAAHTVRAIDHGDMSGLGWSAITIGFSVRPEGRQRSWSTLPDSHGARRLTCSPPDTRRM
ncbi:Cu/Ag efflux protein CusF [Sphingobium subterraneum]|uniref:Cu/Ag efflux protein CusF n=1 Tax=Sphingobium subterraneum TaxID=627688 RepID=A0A841J432_9SPHN|nr:Cu/Ag efflux protein CusF [Sphingobium subterraneum]